VKHWLWPAIWAFLTVSAHAAALPRPVCDRNEVLNVVADEIARRGVTAVIVPDYIGEIPTAAPNTVRCSVRLQTTFYDTNRFGTVPQVRLSTLEFSVHAGRNGLFVDTIGNSH
jgi:hypothetical protein